MRERQDRWVKIHWYRSEFIYKANGCQAHPPQPPDSYLLVNHCLSGLILNSQFVQVILHNCGFTSTEKQISAYFLTEQVNFFTGGIETQRL